MLAKMYLPASFVVVFRESFVEGSVIVTAAPTTAAPVGSVTVPATVPVEAAWENKADGVIANRQDRATTSKITRLLNIQLPPEKTGLAPKTANSRQRHT